MPKELENDETQLDMEAAAADISSELFGQGSDEDKTAEGTESAPGAGLPDEATPSQPASEEEPKVEENSAAVQELGAPETWTKEALADWASIPPRAREEILKREQDFFRGIEQYKEKAQIGDQYSKVAEPYMPILQAENVDPVELFQNFAANHYLLSAGTPEQKAQLAANLIQAYGVDLGQLTNYLADYSAPDPTTQALENRIKELEGRLTRQDQSATTAMQAQVDREIAEFAQSPDHPYFQEVVKDMAALLEAKVASNLQDAYDRAVYANPVTRQKEIDRLTALKAQEMTGKAQEEASKKARSTAADLSLSPKDRHGTMPLGSMDDTLAETLDAIASRS